MRLSRLMLAGVVSAALLVTGCSSGDAAPPQSEDAAADVTTNEYGQTMLTRSDPAKGGTLNVALQGPMTTLSAVNGGGAGVSMILGLIYGQLFTRDGAGELVPVLADGIESPDDGKTWVITLKEDIAFTDGTPFDAAAVAQQLNAVRESNSRAAGGLKAAESIVATDDRTVTVTLAEPSMQWPNILLTLPGHANVVPSPASIAQYGEDAGTAPENTIGAGPYIVESFTPNGDLDLVRNPDYFDSSLPYPDKLHFVTAVDAQSRLQATIAGTLDLGWTQTQSDLDLGTEKGLIALPQPTASFYILQLNNAKAPFDDPDFRLALAEAIDNAALAQSVFDGKQNPMTGYFPKTNQYYVDTDWPTFDPDHAKELVDEFVAGGGDPSFELLIDASPEYQKQADIIAQMLSDVGITMTYQVADIPTQIAKQIDGSFEAELRFTNVNQNPYQDISIGFASDSVENLVKAGDPRVDELLAKAKVTSDKAELTEIYAGIQEAFAEWLPIIPLVQQQAGWYAGPKVGGFPGSGAYNEPDLAQAWVLLK